MLKQTEQRTKVEGRQTANAGVNSPSPTTPPPPHPHATQANTHKSKQCKNLNKTLGQVSGQATRRPAPQRSKMALQKPQNFRQQQLELGKGSGARGRG